MRTTNEVLSPQWSWREARNLRTDIAKPGQIKQKLSAWLDLTWDKRGDCVFFNNLGEPTLWVKKLPVFTRHELCLSASPSPLWQKRKNYNKRRIQQVIFPCNVLYVMDTDLDHLWPAGVDVGLCFPAARCYSEALASPCGEGLNSVLGVTDLISQWLFSCI